MKAYRQRNRVNLVLLSNEAQPLPIDEDDRRHLVVYTPPERSVDYYDALHGEIASGGIEVFYHFLLNLDLSGFHPAKRPPMTAAKRALIRLSLNPQRRFLGDWLGGDLDLPVCPCLSQDLFAAHLAWCRRNGETGPRSAAEFFSVVTCRMGWAREKTRYTSIASGAKDRKPVVFPARDDLSDGYMPPESEDDRRIWLSRCIGQFQSAARQAGLGASS
ncbi:MAG: hypothetical protein J5X21_17995 [Candidatus Accumulibacter sp.]|nr:hypothetical protein [Candidatus Accumulibacter conexus]